MNIWLYTEIKKYNQEKEKENILSQTECKLNMKNYVTIKQSQCTIIAIVL